MEPFFSKQSIRDVSKQRDVSIVDYNVSRVQDILAENPHFPISLYRTLAVSADPTEAHIKKMVDEVAFLRLYPKFLFPYDLFPVAGLHVSAVYIYFISMQAEPNLMMAGLGRKVPFVNNYIDAASDDEQVSMLMRQKRYHNRHWGSITSWARITISFLMKTPIRDRTL